MIKDFKGKRISPKRFSKMILENALEKLEYWAEGTFSDEHEDMTEREREEVQKKLESLIESITNRYNLNQ